MARSMTITYTCDYCKIATATAEGGDGRYQPRPEGWYILYGRNNETRDACGDCASQRSPSARKMEARRKERQPTS